MIVPPGQLTHYFVCVCDLRGEQPRPVAECEPVHAQHAQLPGPLREPPAWRRPLGEHAFTSGSAEDADDSLTSSWLVSTWCDRKQEVVMFKILMMLYVWKDCSSSLGASTPKIAQWTVDIKICISTCQCLIENL